MAQLVGIWRVVCLLGVLAGASAAVADEIVLVSPDYWCPFSCKAGDAQEGFTVDIIREIFSGAGHTVRLVNENYSRALVNVRSGRFTATPSTFREEAQDFIFPDVPISRNRYCFYVGMASPWRYAGPGSLKGRRTGVIRDYSYGADLDPLVRLQPDWFELLSGDNLTQRMVQLVEVGRLDGFVEEENLVAYTLAHHPEWKLRTAGCMGASYAYMALSPVEPKARDYARLFSEGMLRLHKTGRLKTILSNYGLQVWPLPGAKLP
jgi:polar amino acid transport system substrate-binding protein